MRPLDVTDIVMREGRLDDESESVALVTWGALCEYLKPGKQHLPMTPAEIAKARRVLEILMDALCRASRLNPRPLRVVPKGE